MTEQQLFVSYVESTLDQLAHDPDRTVLVSAEGRHITAGQVHDEVHRIAAELADRGIGRGDTVALYSGNRPEALSARYAVNLLGARVVFLYQGMAPEVLAQIVTSVEAALLLVDPELREGVQELAKVTAERMLSFGPSPVAEDLNAAAARQAGRRIAGAARPEDDWCIRHTGGTTGIPKGVRMTHGPYLRQMRWSAGHMAPHPRFLACTSLAHVAGLLSDAAIFAGGQVFLQHGFEPGAVLEAVRRERITHLWLLPPLLYRLLDEVAGTRDPERAEGPDPRMASLRRVTYGGCAASPARLRQAIEVLGPVLHGLYGQAEAGHISEVGPDEHGVTGRGGQVTAGRAGPGVEIAIRDGQGRALPTGQVGEVQVRTPMMMKGYWKQPELTRQVLRDGWVHTGDAGYLDEDGHLFLVDRLKDMIIVVGGHVYPAELEELLLTHPAVAHCAVFGVTGADATEEVHAAVVPTPGETVDLPGIKEFVTRHQGAMYAPSALHVLPEIPLTDAGKPDKRLLREMAAHRA
ncbi:class I adenylate-forming enzyme family protein [Streptomyces palmae]|uniref:Fatty acid--CoA ligase n=1 Tax=Streptomyces palmae TaxID=1701085 RepID=A0A4Z0HGN3_9ACTN|nr:AMP-binding protein [Streptomyces palmae]TGB16812.1 fatty acid--CoA ligase [Streptomyces palmae]